MTKLTSKLVSAKVKGGPGSFADGTFEDSEDEALEVIEEFYPEAHTQAQPTQSTTLADKLEQRATA